MYVRNILTSLSTAIENQTGRISPEYNKTNYQRWFHLLLIFWSADAAEGAKGNLDDGMWPALTGRRVTALRSVIVDFGRVLLFSGALEKSVRKVIFARFHWYI